MTSDDQHFLDFINPVLHIQALTETLENLTDSAANRLRDSLNTATWLPDRLRPKPRPIPSSAKPTIGNPPRLVWWHVSNLTRWMGDNPAICAAIVAFVGTGGWLVWRNKKGYAKKRRAKRGVRGQRTEVVVVVGTADSPIPRSIILDLERRGFLVYVVVDSATQEEAVKAERKKDILPLHLNIIDPFDVQSTMKTFKDMIASSQSSLVNMSSSDLSPLNFAGLVVIPDLTYSTGPIETISPELWSDSLNAKIIHTITTTQAFLRTVIEMNARILMLTPTIVPSLRPAFHAVESTVVNAIEGFTGSLHSELSTVGLDVCHIKLGKFDCENLISKQQLQRSRRADVYEWSAEARSTYARNYVSQETRRGDLRALEWKNSASKGSPLRELNNAVFDALTVKRPSYVWRVGKGSRLYEVVGRWVPPGIVGWMIGLERVEVVNEEESMETSTSRSWEKVERIV